MYYKFILSLAAIFGWSFGYLNNNRDLALNNTVFSDSFSIFIDRFSIYEQRKFEEEKQKNVISNNRSKTLLYHISKLISNLQNETIPFNSDSLLISRSILKNPKNIDLFYKFNKSSNTCFLPMTLNNLLNEVICSFPTLDLINHQQTNVEINPNKTKKNSYSFIYSLNKKLVQKSFPISFFELSLRFSPLLPFKKREKMVERETKERERYWERSGKKTEEAEQKRKDGRLKITKITQFNCPVFPLFRPSEKTGEDFSQQNSYRLFSRPEKKKMSEISQLAKKSIFEQLLMFRSWPTGKIISIYYFHFKLLFN